MRGTRKQSNLIEDGHPVFSLPESAGTANERKGPAPLTARLAIHFHHEPNVTKRRLQAWGGTRVNASKHFPHHPPKGFLGPQRSAPGKGGLAGANFRWVNILAFQVDKLGGERQNVLPCSAQHPVQPQTFVSLHLQRTDWRTCCAVFWDTEQNKALLHCMVAFRN